MRRLTIILLGIAICSCQNRIQEEKIFGAWKVDSSFLYYNGFSYTEKNDDNDWATLLYEPGGTVKEIRYSSFRKHYFKFVGRDSLIFKELNGSVSSAYKVLKLTDKMLILHKEKRPLFDGKNQRRFEVRYYSKTDSNFLKELEYLPGS